MAKHRLGYQVIMWLICICVRHSVYVDAYINFAEKYTIELKNMALLYLTSTTMQNGGEYSINIAIILYGANESVVQNRTMLYLLACDSVAYQYITSTGWKPEGGDLTSNNHICSVLPPTRNQTVLQAMCDSYVLHRIMPQDKFGHVDSRYKDNYVARLTTHQAFTPSDDGVMHLFIDSCETIGGTEGILQSCMTTTVNQCFECSLLDLENVKECQISPPIDSFIEASIDITACSTDGHCTGDVYEPLSKFYVVCTILRFMLLLFGYIYMNKVADENTAGLVNSLFLVFLCEVDQVKVAYLTVY